MTLTIDLQPEIERGLLARAEAKGLSLAAYAQEVLSRDATPAESESPQTGQTLVNVCARVRGLLTDEEVDTLFARSPSVSRTVDFS